MYDEYLIQKETLSNISGEVRNLSGSTSVDLSTDEMISGLNQANEEINSQSSLIEQAISKLEGKVGGAGGIDTSDATATANDIASGKTAYVDGQKITGNVVTLESGQTGYLDEGATGFSFSATNNQFSAMIPMGYNVLFRNGSYINAPVSTVLFGDATAADVVKGKTFTSKNGLKITGTYKSSGEGGSLPNGITAIESGTFTLPNDTTQISVNHTLGAIPSFIVIIPTESNFDFDNEPYYIHNITMVLKKYITANDVQYDKIARAYYTNVAAQYIFNEDINTYGTAATESSFSIQTTSSKFKSGVIYRWYACVGEGFG